MQGRNARNRLDTRSGLGLLYGIRYSVAHHVIAWLSVALPGLTWPGPACPELAWPGLAWPSLVWATLTWSGLALPGLAWASEDTACLALAHALEIEVLRSR